MNSSKDLQVRSWNYGKCCQDLAGEGRKRDTLKRLLVHAKQASLTRWSDALSAELTKTRRDMNRLYARRTRLRGALGLGS